MGNMTRRRLQPRDQPDVGEPSRPVGRTHDIANLYVSDGSQFTTAAADNPTLTIVALAIRQADRLATELSRGSL